MILNGMVFSCALNLPIEAQINSRASDPNMRTKLILKHLFLTHYPRSLLLKKQGFAGFPSESADYLGDLADYMAFDVLGIQRPATFNHFSLATLWKLANVEYTFCVSV